MKVEFGKSGDKYFCILSARSEYGDYDDTVILTRAQAASLVKVLTAKLNVTKKK